MNYIRQTPDHGAICALITLYNACIHLGLTPPSYPSELWEEYVDLSGGRHGACISTDQVAKRLGLTQEPLDVQGEDWRQAIASHTPVSLTLWNPRVGSSLHEVLVIKADDQGATLVNYRTEDGPTVETLPWGDTPPQTPYKPEAHIIKQMHEAGHEIGVTVPDRGQQWQAIYLPRSGNVNRRALALKCR